MSSRKDVRTSTPIRKEKHNTGIVPDEPGTDFTKYQIKDKSLQSRIMALCGTDEDLYEHFKKAVKYSDDYPDKQFSVTIKGHDDTAGKYSVHVVSLCYDIPDIETLAAGRYRLVLKYFDPRQPVKGGSLTNRGAVKTIWRDFSIRNDKGDISEGVQGIRANPPAGAPGSLLSDFKQYQGLINDVHALLNETVKYQLETIRIRDQIEEKSYGKGVEVGRLQKELEFERAEKEKALAAAAAIPQAPGLDLPGILEALASGDSAKILAAIGKAPAGNAAES
ncbi:MAG: hypothetical protein AB2L13_21045 [Spirochaetota bacterium]